MNNQPDVDESTLQIHPFELSRTLDETEWSGVLGRRGLGWRLLTWMHTLAAPWFELVAARMTQNARSQALFFEIDGVEHCIELDFDPGLRATLLGAARAVINGVNQALKCAQLHFRFVLERQPSSGNRSAYRLILAPRYMLAELGPALNLVAGISPEDYEHAMLTPGRPFFTDEFNRSGDAHPLH